MHALDFIDVHKIRKIYGKYMDTNMENIRLQIFHIISIYFPYLFHRFPQLHIFSIYVPHLFHIFPQIQIFSTCLSTLFPYIFHIFGYTSIWGSVQLTLFTKLLHRLLGQARQFAAEKSEATTLVRHAGIKCHASWV